MQLAHQATYINNSLYEGRTRHTVIQFNGSCQQVLARAVNNDAYISLQTYLNYLKTLTTSPRQDGHMIIQQLITFEKLLVGNPKSFNLIGTDLWG